eukprot:gene5644-7792_t
MEHIINDDELDITSKLDFILPLKQVGLITRSVLEAIALFYNPKRIIVVSPRAEGPILMKLVHLWNVSSTVLFIEEETFFMNNFNLSIKDIVSHYDPNRGGDQREPGWWIQQLIKLGAATQIPDLSEVYVVWDGDLVPTRRWKLCERERNGNIKYYIGILQAEARSIFNSEQYAKCMEALTGFSPLEPTNGGTFVAHHMVFQKKYVNEMLTLMANKTESKDPWPIMIMSQSKVFYRFSEYKTYATFMIRYHPNDFNYHELQMFGEGGLRFREANNIIDEMVRECPLKDGGLSYYQVRSFVVHNWKRLPSHGQFRPAYVQLDHVYGLAGIELNISDKSNNNSVQEDNGSLIYSPPSAVFDKIKNSKNATSTIRKSDINLRYKPVRFGSNNHSIENIPLRSLFRVETV